MSMRARGMGGVSRVGVSTVDIQEDLPVVDYHNIVQQNDGCLENSQIHLILVQNNKVIQYTDKKYFLPSFIEACVLANDLSYCPRTTAGGATESFFNFTTYLHWRYILKRTNT